MQRRPSSGHQAATISLHLGTIAAALLRDRPIHREESSVRLRIDPADVEWTVDGLRWRRTNWEPDHDFRFNVGWDVPETFDDGRLRPYPDSGRRSTDAPSAASLSDSFS